VIRKCRLRDFFGQWWGHFAFLLLVPLAPLCAFGYFRNPVSQTFFSTPIDCQSTTPFTLGFQPPCPLLFPLLSCLIHQFFFFFGEGVAKGGGQMHLFSDSIIQCWVLSLLSPEFWPTGQVLPPPLFFPNLPSQKSKKTLRCPVMFYFSWSSCWQHSKPVHQRQTGTWQDC